MRHLLYICIAVLLAGVLPLPYSLYAMLHFVVAGIFGYLCYRSYGAGHKTAAYVLLVLTILYQPLLRIPLGRALWITVDVVLALGVAVLLNSRSLLASCEKKFYKRPRLLAALSQLSASLGIK